MPYRTFSVAMTFVANKDKVFDIICILPLQFSIQNGKCPGSFVFVIRNSEAVLNFWRTHASCTILSIGDHILNRIHTSSTKGCIFKEHNGV